MTESLDDVYGRRFSDEEAVEKHALWRVICHHLQRYVEEGATVLDLACDRGYFIQNITAGERWATDVRDVSAFLPEEIHFVQTDGLTLDRVLPPASFDVWHDRAVFHFLTTWDDQQKYLEHLGRVLRMHGSAIIATFAPDGPEKCSGLPVSRYSPESLAQRLGSGFARVESRRHLHHTPWGSTQAFQYSRFIRVN